MTVLNDDVGMMHRNWTSEADSRLSLTENLKSTNSPHTNEVGAPF